MSIEAVQWLQQTGLLEQYVQHAATIIGEQIKASMPSRRDHFAAHAPDVPTWFEHTPPSRTGLPANPTVDELDETHRKLAEDWRRDPCFDLPEELAWWERKVEAYREACQRWNNEDRLARMAQWRYHYADLMVGQQAA